MKSAALAAVLLCCSLGLRSQSSINLGLLYGQRVNLPLMNNRHKRVVGISAEYTRPIFPNTDLRITTGVEANATSLLTSTDGWLDYYWKDYVVVPVRAGVQQYFYRRRVFLYGDAGLAVGSFPWAEGVDIPTRTNLSYALGGGYRFAYGPHSYLQPTLSFNRYPYRAGLNFSWVNLRVAYGLQWKGRGGAAK